MIYVLCATSMSIHLFLVGFPVYSTYVRINTWFVFIESLKDKRCGERCIGLHLSIDLCRFKAGQPLEDGALRLLEQLPGISHQVWVGKNEKMGVGERERWGVTTQLLVKREVLRCWVGWWVGWLIFEYFDGGFLDCIKF